MTRGEAEALLGFTILLLVIAFPQGIVGFIRDRFGDDTADNAEKSGPQPSQRTAIKEGL